MSSEKSRDLIRRGFILAAAFGLLLNLIFAFLSFTKNRQSDRLGEFVLRSSRASLHVERLDRALSQTLPQKEKVQHELLELQKYESVLPSGFSTLTLEQQIQNSPNDAIATLASLRDAMDIELIKREEADNALNSVVDRDMMLALSSDFVLIGLMLALFILNMRAKIRVENNLKTSLFSLRESMRALEEEAHHRQVEAQTTVHDLKNPIGTIMSFAQIMNEDRPQMSAADVSERIRRISERSLLLVESLLSTDRTATLSMKEVDVIALAEDICSQLDFQARQKSQKILREFKMPKAMVMGNSLKLEELIVNILSNAIKYSPIKGKIRFCIYKLGNHLRLEIEDQGPGFSEFDKQNAFQYGQRLSAQPTANESSTGFGLYISKQIAALHKGNIQIVDACESHGSRLVIDLPLIAA